MTHKPRAQSITLPGHRADCECDACADENEEMRRWLREARRDVGHQLSGRYFAGFIAGWVAARRKEWRERDT